MSKIDEEFGKQTPQKGTKVPEIGGFNKASEVKVDEYDKRLNQELNVFLKVFDISLQTAKENTLEGWGFNVEVDVDQIGARISTTPPPRTGGSWGGGGGRPEQKVAFSKEKAMAVVTENQDLITFEEKDGKFTVKTRKYLEKDWAPINAKLREAGMLYSKEAKAWLPVN